jgi:hypothetical protein
MDLGLWPPCRPAMSPQAHELAALQPLIDRRRHLCAEHSPRLRILYHMVRAAGLENATAMASPPTVFAVQRTLVL